LVFLHGTSLYSFKPSSGFVALVSIFLFTTEDTEYTEKKTEN